MEKQIKIVKAAHSKKGADSMDFEFAPFLIKKPY